MIFEGAMGESLVIYVMIGLVGGLVGCLLGLWLQRR